MSGKAFRVRRVAAAFALMMLVVSNALGWGREGHQIAVVIAERHLTATARERVRQILGPDTSLAAVSTWADEIRPSRPETAPWHYVDIPLNASAIDLARDCPNGDCVITAINNFEELLRDKTSMPEAKNEALKFIVHFIADLHQPLHCADDHDRGGNDLHVTFFGEKTNLHSVWDTLLIERIDPDSENYANRLDADLTDLTVKAFEQGTVEDWALLMYSSMITPVCTETPKSARNPTPDETLKFVCVTRSASKPPIRASSSPRTFG
jgi:hypothetical protein